MKIFSKLTVLLALSLVALTSCGKDEAEPIDRLEEVGILGQWKLEVRSVNGISSLALECCATIEFKTDGEPTDLKGAFTSTDTASEANGVFELNTATDTVQFNYGNTQLLYGFQISQDYLTFTYLEGDAEVVEGWRREE